jgi:hemolysin activation/secretion protein
MNNFGLVLKILSVTALFCCYGAEAKTDAHNVEPAKAHAAKEQSKSCKKVRKYNVVGSKLYSDTAFQEQLKEFQGLCFERSLEDKIATKINNFYQEHGYIYSFVTNIEFDGSTAQITVTEGHIKEVIYNEDFENPQLIAYTKKLMEIQPYNSFQAARYIELIKRLPGINGNLILKPIIKPFDDLNPEDSAIISLLIENHFYNVLGYLSFDNRSRDLRSDTVVMKNSGSVYTKHKGPNFLTALATINNPFALGGQITTSVSTSMNHEDNSFALGYRQPINTYGTDVLTSVSTSIVKWPIQQQTPSIELGISHPFFLSTNHSIEGFTKLKQYNAKNQYIHTPPQYESINVKKLVLGANYKLKDKFKGKHHYILHYHQSIKTNQANLQTSSHDKSFSKIVAQGEITYPILSSDYMITLNANGQYSKNNLLRTEVFTTDLYKGARGFDESEAYGDKGLATSIEFSRFFNVRDHLMFRGVRPYTYIDRSKFWNNVESIYKPKAAMLMSYGVGTDLHLHDNIIFNFEYSKPLKKTVQARYFQFDKKPSSRVYFGIRYEFGF